MPSWAWILVTVVLIVGSYFIDAKGRTWLAVIGLILYFMGLLAAVYTGDARWFFELALGVMLILGCLADWIADYLRVTR